ncbi:UDP-N-acetylmuramate:L-alanyl-gamma-D-glutamyl-meso-diaminopimelate ligase [uncultured Desulfobacterium sp.]|uniref:UDP-N-acetylmuramate:L-alanyl-gamma-D-glutamyl-meso-diaminopimelate ligase n=1 Tax=uncultured Desulfobacterium sp. TaxID=201089 RepID=A0A445MYK1_9BACT|nr:UDP-N-acetylmuramate:L-alanyl-gamma-D-glutamyl-meso-diaminopimelate ligase [uncultured Desulfobacterium sp.]
MTTTDDNNRKGLLPDLNRLPDSPGHIHLMGICGTAMASLAGILKQKGYNVTGSDQDVYPPMSIFLEKLSIPVLSGYRTENLDPRPDLVIVGNVITRVNPEAVELARLNLPYLSLPQALKHFAFKDKQPIVICGTHGKTTTSSLAAWVLDVAGRDPGFMIGGIPRNFDANFKLGNGRHFVIEGDEYDTAFFDKGPKFLHYAPWVAILTSIEFDHADIYRDLDHVIENFRKLINIMKPDGFLIANMDDPIIAAEAVSAKCPVISYGLSKKALFTAKDIEIKEGLTHLTVMKNDKKHMGLSTTLYGRHNISNLLSVVALADLLGLSPKAVSKALVTFEGVKRRQEVVGESHSVIVLDDFAHHPTAVKETINAVRQRYEGRRLIAVFEPRSNSSRRNIFQVQYAQSFNDADIVMIPEPPLMEKIPKEERFSSRQLVEDLQKNGLNAHYFPNTDQLLEAMVRESRPNDIFLIMSNGGFDNIHKRLLKRLQGD